MTALRYLALAAASLAVVVLAVAGCREQEDAAQATTGRSPARPYALAPTRRCLRSRGASVSKVRSTDPRLRALGDLAQRTSFQIELRGMRLGLAFGDARLLASLLRVPDDPYRIEVRRNALLMYRPAARRQAAVVRACLRS